MPGSCRGSRTNDDAVDETDEVGKRAARAMTIRGEFDAKTGGFFFFFFCMSEFSMADFERKAQACGRQAWDERQAEIEMGGKGVIECEKYGKWR